MKINLNDPNDFTIENVRNLMLSEDDSVNTQYRVTKDGFLILSRNVGNRELDGILFRLETNVAYNGYAGPNAANNQSWVKRIFDVVKKNWPHPSASYIDTY